MRQDRQTPTTTITVASPFARAGFERPVEHLHFDRRARVWWSHSSLDRNARSGHAAALTADGVSE